MQIINQNITYHYYCQACVTSWYNNQPLKFLARGIDVKPLLIDEECPVHGLMIFQDKNEVYLSYTLATVTLAAYPKTSTSIMKNSLREM